MTAELTQSLTLAMPELILAVGAMALLMIGVFSGERANTTVTGLASKTFSAMTCEPVLTVTTAGDSPLSRVRLLLAVLPMV